MTPVFPLQPDPGLLVITSNGVHAMQKEIEQAAGRKVLSMVDATLEEVRKRDHRYTLTNRAG